MQEKKNPLHSLMEGDVTLISSATCVLARLWRLMLFRLNVKAAIWEALLTNFSEACKAHMSKDQASFLKGNLPKRLAKDTIMWDRFCLGITVFDFEDVLFQLVLTDGDVTKQVHVRIPPTYTGVGGTYLKVLWDSMNKAFPDRMENWRDYVKNYTKRCEEEYGEGSDHLKGNVTRALCKDSITWATFYRGLIIHDYDSVVIELLIKQRGITDWQVVKLNLVNR